MRMRHKLVIEVPGSGALPLVEPFEAGSLGAEVFSHVTLVCRRIPPFELSRPQVGALQSALLSGLLWGQASPANLCPPADPALISHVRLLTEQPDGGWAPAHDFELGR